MSNDKFKHDYELLEKATTHILNKLESKLGSKTKTKSKANKPNCPHKNIIEEDNIKVCEDCGLEIYGEISFDKDWKFYGLSGDGRKTLDPNRCFRRKTEVKNIFKDVENMGFSEKTISVADEIYNKVANGKIFRGDFRKAIIFACIFYTYKKIGKPISFNKLRTCFNVNRSMILKGMKKVNNVVAKMDDICDKYITPVEIINEIMDSMSATKSQKNRVIDLYEKIKNRSPVINRSRPQSIASGVIYNFIQNEGKNISIKDFTKRVKLSELTILKISKEIDKLLN